MWILVRRELALMSHYWNEAKTDGRFILGLIRYWIFFSIGIFLPGFLFEKFLGTPLESTVATVVMVFTLVIAQNNLLEDEEQRQTLFLQTLPIRKSYIVHAKMVSIFFLWSFNFIWFLLPIAMIQLNRSEADDLWPQFGFFMSLALFVISVQVLCYFLWGYRRQWLVFFFSIIVWVAVAAPVGFALSSVGKESQSLLFVFPLLLAVITFFACWWGAVRRMNSKGFAFEGNKGQRIRRIQKEDRV